MTAPLLVPFSSILAFSVINQELRNTFFCKSKATFYIPLTSHSLPGWDGDVRAKSWNLWDGYHEDHGHQGGKSGQEDLLVLSWTSGLPWIFILKDFLCNKNNHYCFFKTTKPQKSWGLGCRTSLENLILPSLRREKSGEERGLFHMLTSSV